MFIYLGQVLLGILPKAVLIIQVFNLTTQVYKLGQVGLYIGSSRIIYMGQVLLGILSEAILIIQVFNLEKQVYI